VGSLALGAIASGAFRVFLLRRVTLEDAAWNTADQMAELARFVDQVSPDVVQLSSRLGVPHARKTITV
jgi:hypothetical protein